MGNASVVPVLAAVVSRTSPSIRFLVFTPLRPLWSWREVGKVSFWIFLECMSSLVCLWRSHSFILKVVDGGSQIFGHAPRGSMAASWTRRGGTTSRLSLASSSGAESYNSFQLLAEQAGATWRELWRTRLLLIDALHWAQSAAAASATENPPPPPPQSSDQQQQQLIATTSMMMAYLMGQQQQQPVGAEVCCGGGGERTPDSVMMAALMAATAAAQAAMQQGGLPQHSTGAGLLPPIPTLPTTPVSFSLFVLHCM